MLTENRKPRRPDRTSQSAMVIDFIPALRAYARSLTRNTSDADDLVQETLLKAIDKLHQFENGTNLRAWLFTIMRNSFYNAVAKGAREATGAADCASGRATAPCTQEWPLRGKELVQAIDQLAPHYRETLVLVVVIGESYERAAQICGCSVGTVKSRVARARGMVINMLENGATG